MGPLEDRPGSPVWAETLVLIHRAQVHTSALPVVGLCQELSDFVRRDGEGDARRHLQRVDAHHFAVLKQQIRMSNDVSGSPGGVEGQASLPG